MSSEVPPSPGRFFEWCMRHADRTDVPFRTNYPQYFASSGRAEYLWRSYDRRLVDVIPFARPGVRVLEIGCGIGADLHWFALRGSEATGIDVKSEWTAAAQRLTRIVREHFGEVAIDIRRTNLLDLGHEEFDLIYMKDTFHHLEPRDAVVSKIAALLAPGGKIVIVEPNAWNPMIQYKMFSIRGFRTIIEKIDSATGEHFIYGNERLLTGGKIERLFKGSGIDGKSRRFRLLPTALATKVSLARTAQALESIGADSILAPLAIHCVYVGNKPGHA